MPGLKPASDDEGDIPGGEFGKALECDDVGNTSECGEPASGVCTLGGAGDGGAESVALRFGSNEGVGVTPVRETAGELRNGDGVSGCTCAFSYQLTRSSEE